MNQVTLIGRLTRDPELRVLPNSGKSVARFSIAVNREFSKEKEADFFDIVVWGKPAESCANYLTKGRLVGVNGSMRNNNYEDKNGVKHYRIEVNAQRVEFLEWGDRTDKPENGNQPSGNNQQTNNNQKPKNDENFNGFQAIDDDDDIPF